MRSAEPGYPAPGHPAYADPGYADPAYADPAYAQPGYAQPGAPPGYAQAGYQAGYPEPGYAPPAYPDPEYPQPEYAQPEYPQPGYPRPEYPEPVPAGYAEPAYPDHPRQGPVAPETAHRPAGRRDTGWVTTDGIPVTEPDLAEPPAPDQDLAASRATVAAWTIFYFALPTVLYLAWAFTRSATPPPYCLDAPECAAPRTEAFAAFVDLLPALAGAVALAVAVSTLMRRLTRAWRPGTVGFAAAVIGAGLATLAVSVVR